MTAVSVAMTTLAASAYAYAAYLNFTCDPTVVAVAERVRSHSRGCFRPAASWPRALRG